MQKEIWKDIPEFEGYYQVSNHGRLKSFKQKEKGVILSNVNKKGGYFSVVLEVRSANLIRYVRMHVLIAEAFIGPRPKKYHIHHKDGNKQNNHVCNLDYLSAKDHAILESKENPLRVAGMNKYNQEIKTKRILQYDLKGNFIKEHLNGREAYLFSGVCHRNILQVAGKDEYRLGLTRKQAGGFRWAYKEDVV